METAQEPKPKCLSYYTHAEARTATGELVKFECHPDDIEEIKRFLATKVRHIELTTTHFVSNSDHGGFGKYSRYGLKQLKYAGGGGPGWGGYIEVLEITNPPDGRHNIVIYEHNSSRRDRFTEWESLDAALKAFETCWGDSRDKILKQPGLLRTVECGLLTPWFYAIGEEELVGDYAFPEILQEHPVYRFGRKFVVMEYDYNSRHKTRAFRAIKTCMGARRIVQKDHDHWRRQEYEYFLVQWDDGTVTKIDETNADDIRPAEEGELWIEAAFLEFRKLLAGKTTKFRINFTDGNYFIGQLKTPKELTPSPQGRYTMRIVFENGKDKEGWVDFKPRGSSQNIVQFLERKLAKSKSPVKKIVIIDQETEKDGKKWAGVYYDRSASEA